MFHPRCVLHAWQQGSQAQKGRESAYEWAPAEIMKGSLIQRIFKQRIWKSEVSDGNAKAGVANTAFSWPVYGFWSPGSLELWSKWEHCGRTPSTLSLAILFLSIQNYFAFLVSSP